MRTSIITASIIAFCLPAPAWAQTNSTEMTCEQAVAYYERHNRIETVAEGEVIPLDEGVPVSQRNDLPCEPGSLPAPVFVPTKDKRECAVAYSCPEE